MSKDMYWLKDMFMTTNRNNGKAICNPSIADKTIYPYLCSKKHS